MVGTQVLQTDDSPNTAAFPPNGTIEYAQEILVGGSDIDVRFIKIFGSKIGAPGTSATIRIETDSGGFPSGTLVDASATLTFNPNDFINWTSVDSNTYEFSGTFTLSASTIYHVVMDIGNSWIDSSNRFGWGVDTANPYANGVRENGTIGGSSWTVTSTQDFSLTLYEPNPVVPSDDIDAIFFGVEF